MRHFIDQELRGHGLIFDGPLDLVTNAKAAYHRKPLVKNLSVNWPGRRGDGWADMERFLHSPWPEGVKMVEYVVERIKKTDLPMPKDVRRKPRWSEDDGDVDVDRVLRGEADYMRDVRRQRVSGSFQVSLISNLDCGRGHRCNPSGVFFRSACCIALADVLESIGYSVEIWTWTRGTHVFPKPNHHQFVACRPKRMGDPVDYDALCDTMSSWFTSKATFGAFAANPVAAPLDLGYLCEADSGTLLLSECGMGGWEKHLDLEQGTLPVCIPLITGWSREDGLESATEKARLVLDHIVRSQS